MIHMIACNMHDCPWRRNRACGCTHPNGAGKVLTRRSLKSAVPKDCPVQREPDILVSPPPAGGLLTPTKHVIAAAEHIRHAIDTWVELARTVNPKRA